MAEFPTTYLLDPFERTGLTAESVEGNVEETLGEPNPVKEAEGTINGTFTGTIEVASKKEIHAVTLTGGEEPRVGMELFDNESKIPLKTTIVSYNSGTKVIVMSQEATAASSAGEGMEVVYLSEVKSFYASKYTNHWKKIGSLTSGRVRTFEEKIGYTATGESETYEYAAFWRYFQVPNPAVSLEVQQLFAFSNKVKVKLTEGSTTVEVTKGSTNVAPGGTIEGFGIPGGTTIIKSVGTKKWEMSAKAITTVSTAEEATISSPFYNSILACLQEPESTQYSGYALKLRCDSGSLEGEKVIAFGTLLIEKIVKGKAEVLNEVAHVQANKGTSFGLTVEKGVLKAWFNDGKEWKVLTEANDSTWTTGYIGVGTGIQHTYVKNFKANLNPPVETINYPFTGITATMTPIKRSKRVEFKGEAKLGELTKIQKVENVEKGPILVGMELSGVSIKAGTKVLSYNAVSRIIEIDKEVNAAFAPEAIKGTLAGLEERGWGKSITIL